MGKKKNKEDNNLFYYELRVDGVNSNYELGFSSKEELSFDEAKEYAYKMGLFDNEDDKYYVLGYNSLDMKQFKEKYD